MEPNQERVNSRIGAPGTPTYDELHQEWQAFATALGHTPELIYIFDLKGRFTYVNRSLLSLWEKTLDQAIGKNFIELDYPPELAGRLQRQIQQVIDTRTPIRDEMPFTGVNGETRHYEYLFTPVPGSDGLPAAVVGLTRDVTEQRQAEKARGRAHFDDSGKPTRSPGSVFEIIDRKQSEEALLESEQQFHTLAESIPNLAWMAHADGSIFWYNRRWYEFTGKTPEEMEGWGWQAVHDAAVLPEVMAKWTDSIASGEPFEMVFPLRRADGAFRSFLTRVEPVRDSQQKVVRWFGTNTDITARMAIEEELRRKNRELEEFAFVASHDLQEPLRMVNIYTQLILKRCETEDVELRRYAGFVYGGVTRMSELLKDLLTFSSTGYGEELPVGTADLSKPFEEACMTLKARFEEAGATIIAPPLPRVRGEADQLFHVFQNVLSNALKYRKKDLPPAIEISAQRKDEFWVISIRDNGIGFAPQYSQQIFGLFKRLHKDAYEGTGLGLAICKRIVERYGGQIWAESKPGEGATFHFALAAAE